jgi:hypothetical protein
LSGFLKDEKAQSERSGVPFEGRARADLQFFFIDPSSPFFCDACHKPLGVWHILRCALFRKQGSSYLVPCKSCRTDNKRIKGAMKTGFDERWTDSKESDYREELMKK